MQQREHWTLYSNMYATSASNYRSHFCQKVIKWLDMTCIFRRKKKRRNRDMYVGIFQKLVGKKKKRSAELTLESVSSAHFCTSQNVSIRALATLFKVSSELLASWLTASSSAAGRALTMALAPSRGATGRRTWSARAQPFLHRASSSEDFCFSMSLQQTHRALWN